MSEIPQAAQPTLTSSDKYKILYDRYDKLIKQYNAEKDDNKKSTIMNAIMFTYNDLMKYADIVEEKIVNPYTNQKSEYEVLKKIDNNQQNGGLIYNPGSSNNSDIMYMITPMVILSVAIVAMIRFL